MWKKVRPPQKAAKKIFFRENVFCLKTIIKIYLFGVQLFSLQALIYLALLISLNLVKGARDG
jgi:hypothetical protein